MTMSSGISYSSWLLYAFIFNYVVHRFYSNWWIRYNYTFSVALDAGTAIAMIVIFLTLTLPKINSELNWWGNK
jgi:hypothetical protein